MVSALEPHAREPEDDVLVDVLDMVSEPLEVATDPGNLRKEQVLRAGD